eukprot:GILK01008008.1.p1 GENE.GILK01008008.1~~GILK01008008.1.p1  ORF type:complete len:568 (-),score=63.82 GILK01008008.1:321-1982(-)
MEKLEVESSSESLQRCASAQSIASDNTKTKATPVICRFRPESFDEIMHGGSPCVQFFPDNKQVAVDVDGQTHSFMFDRVLPPDCEQAEVSEIVAPPMIDAILNGFNAAIIAYGQTGSGKTYTMMGPPSSQGRGLLTSDPHRQGLIPRILDQLFRRLAERRREASLSDEGAGAATTTVIASYVEIYCEKIKDLLTPAKDNIQLRQDSKRGLWITDASQVPVSNTHEAMGVLDQGSSFRQVAQTKSNTDSSRSHAVFLLSLRNSFDSRVTHSQLYLVDLAGSEKVGKTGAEGLRLDEAKSINKSLLALGNVIMALTSKAKHIPYRDSKLTRLLENSFGGNSYTCVIVCCSPSRYNDRETLSSLRFGDRANRIQNKPRLNEEHSVDELKRLLQESHSQNRLLQVRLRESKALTRQQGLLIHELLSLLDRDSLKHYKNKYGDLLQHVNDQAHTLTQLPFNVKSCIFRWLDGRTILNCASINRDFTKTLRAESIWRAVLVNEVFGKQADESASAVKRASTVPNPKHFYIRHLKARLAAAPAKNLTAAVLPGGVYLAHH